MDEQYLALGLSDALLSSLRRALPRDCELVAAEDAKRARSLLEDRATLGMALALSADGALELVRAYASQIPMWVTVDDTNVAKAAEATSLGAMDAVYERVPAPLLEHRVANLLEAAQLRYCREHDPLTGLYNRDGFFRTASEMLATNPNLGFALQLWDVQRFKIVNELYGSETGDRLLKSVADAMRAVVPQPCVCARMQGDRFALCAPGDASGADQLLSAVEDRLGDTLASLSIALYGGVYPIAGQGLGVEQMCDRALMALDTVKGKYHRHCAVFTEQMSAALLQEQWIVAEMNRALNEGEFCVYLQPLYSITTGEPISAEALVRWKHPERGMVAPGAFIPLFERNGFITKLDAYVWEIACRYLRDAQALGVPTLPISVNVSRLNFFNPKLCDNVLALVRRYGVDPSLLKLEITESAYTDDPQQLLSAMRELQRNGFQILMDDFGSGYSSLNMLKDVPVDILKVDMRFLEGMEENSRAGNVMTSIIRMAKWLKIVVVAEGVETRAQIDFLRSIGCDRVQGFYYSKPLPIEQYNDLMLHPVVPAPEQTDAVEREKLLSSYEFDSVWDGSQRVSLLFEAMLGAIGLYERSGDVLEVVRVNEGYYELTGYTPQTLNAADADALQSVEPADRQALLDACDRACASHAVEQAQVRRRRQDGAMLWLDVKIRHLGNVGKRALFYFALSDVTRLKALERSELLSQYGAAMLDAYSEVLEMNFTDNAATSVSLSASSDAYRTRTVPLDYALGYFVNNRVHPLDREAFLSLYSEERLKVVFGKEKRRSVAIEVRVRRVGMPYHWSRLTIYPMDDPMGKNKALSCNRIIDEQKLNEQIREENRVLQAKQHEQNRYRLIVEQARTAVVEWDFERHCAVGSPLYRDYVVSSADLPKLLQGEIPPDCVHSQDLPQLRGFLHNVRGGDARVEANLRLCKRDGTSPWCAVTGNFRRTAGGELNEALVTIRDIDKERSVQLLYSTQMEENARRLNELTSLYWTLPCAIFQTDADGGLLFYNRACWLLFGYKHKSDFEKAMNGSIGTLLLPEDKPLLADSLRRCCEERAEQELLLRIRRADGSEGVIRGTLNAGLQTDGKPMYRFVFVDITKLGEQERHLRDAQARLQQSADQLQGLLERIPVGVAMIELGDELRVAYVNEQCYRIFGVKDGNLEAFARLFKLRAPGADRAELTKLLRQPEHLRNGSTTGRYQRADGTPIWLRCYTSVFAQEGLPPLCYAVLVDVSKQAEVNRAYQRQTELYRILMEDSQVLFFDYDVESDAMHYSVPRAGGEREELTMSRYLEALPAGGSIAPEYADMLGGRIRACSRKPQSGELKLKARFSEEGAYRWYRVFYRCVTDESDAVYHIIGRMDDIQDEVSTEEQLNQVRIFRRAVRSVSLFMYEQRLPSGKPELMGEPGESAVYYPFGDYLDPALNEALIAPEERPRLLEMLDGDRLRRLYKQGVHDLTLQFRALSRQDAWVWLELTLHISHADGRDAARCIGYVKEIAERKELEEKARTDGVTGLLNRATIEERVAQALAKPDELSCLMIFDVDDFKSVNDTLGHIEGDRLLRSVADALRKHFRQSDSIGRLGGDEFIALLSNVKDASIAEDKARGILAEIRAMSDRLRWEHPITVSIGIASAPRDGATFAELYKHADKALYQSKGLGKNRYSVYRADG